MSGLIAHGGATSTLDHQPPLTRSDVLTTTEVARLLQMPASTVYYVAGRGDLPVRRLSRKWHFLVLASSSTAIVAAFVIASSDGLGRLQHSGAYSVILLVGRLGGRLDEGGGAGRSGELGGADDVRVLAAGMRDGQSRRTGWMDHDRVGHLYVVRARGTGIAYGRAIRASFSARVNLGRFTGRSVPTRVAVAAHVVWPRTDARPFIRARPMRFGSHR